MLKEKMNADFTYSPQRYDEAKTVSAALGSSVNLTQELTGGDFQFTWFKNLQDKTNIISESYTINNVKEEDYSIYTCEAYTFEQLPKELMEISFYREPITLLKDLATEEIARNLIVFPNPTTDFINIKTTKLDIEKIFIHDLAGKLIYSGKSMKINVSNFPSANYIISIKTSEGVKSFKFIKI